MQTDDGLHFAQQRLRHHPSSPLTRTLGWERKPRVLRRFAFEIPEGEARTFDKVDDTVQVVCAGGSVWVTHDGDCKDVILQPGESYRADREQAMHLFALQPCVLELEFEDDVLDD